MIESLTVRTFKSLEDVTVDLGLVNVFIGANGSGKSNLLEAVGEDDSILVSRMPTQKAKTNPERGLAALKTVESAKGDALDLLRLLQGYAVFSPATAVLRGVAPETQPRLPVGLSGGNLPRAILDLLEQRDGDKRSKRICRDALGLVDWAKSFGSKSADRMPLSPAAAASKTVIRFRDRYMREGRNILSGYDASEGALYALFLAVIAGHQASPALCAVDNADHGLNPRLARSLMERLCGWYLDAGSPRQILLTTHSPLVLDGLPLQDDRVRLFTVSRTSTGRTSIRRVDLDDSLMAKAEQGWSLSRLWVMGHLGGVPDV